MQITPDMSFRARMKEFLDGAKGSLDQEQVAEEIELVIIRKQEKDIAWLLSKIMKRLRAAP